jgi:hypothetical protein
VFSSTATVNECDFSSSTVFEIPAKEKVDAFFKDLLSSTARNIAGPSGASVDQTADEGGKRLSEIADKWREIEVSAQIDTIRRCCNPATGKAIADRLAYLRQCVWEEEGPGVDISLDSLRAMRAFIAQIPDVRLPEISLTTEGGVYLRWKSGADRLFSIHFYDDRRVRFATFYPNPRHEGMINRHSGYETIDTVLASADRICSVREWITG